jgi:hypothetical protein
MTAPGRPHRPESACPGFEWTVEPRSNWRLATGKRCRHLVSGGEAGRRHGCGQPSVAEINRGRHVWGKGTTDSWWAYCDNHLREYGNWIEDGRVMSWTFHQVADAAPDGDRS